MTGGDPEEALGGTGQVSGGDPIADKQTATVPHARPPSRPPARSAQAEEDEVSDLGIPLRSPVQPDGS